MKVSRKKILDALSIATRIAAKHSPKAILQKLAINLNGELSISASTTDVGIGEVYLPYIERWNTNDRRFCVAPKELVTAVKSRKDCDVVIDINESTITVDGTTTIPIECADSFPTIGATNGDSHSFSLESSELRQAIEACKRAVDLDSSRYALGGIMLSFSPRGKFSAIATDGRRLHLYGTVDPSQHGAILPQSAIPGLLAILKADCAILVTIGKNDIRVSSDNWQFLTRQLEGQFPKWEEVFPKCEYNVSFDRADFESLVTRAKGFATIAIKGAHITACDNVLSLRLKTESSVFHDTIGCNMFDAVTASLDVRYLVDFCHSIPKPKSTRDKQTIHAMFDQDHACVLTHDAVLAMIMPLEKGGAK